MADTTIQLVGLKELQAKLENLLEIGGKPSRALDQAGRKAWRGPLEEAQRLVPKDSWALHDSLAVTVKRSGKWLGASSVHVSGLMIRRVDARKRYGKYGVRNGAVPNPRRYWHLVEFGTSKQGPHQFIRPAVDPHAAEVVQTFARELGKSVEKALSKQEKINGDTFE